MDSVLQATGVVSIECHHETSAKLSGESLNVIVMCFLSLIAGSVTRVYSTELNERGRGLAVLLSSWFDTKGQRH